MNVLKRWYLIAEKEVGRLIILIFNIKMLFNIKKYINNNLVSYLVN